MRSPLKYRWIYVQTNLQVNEEAERVIALGERAKKLGYNGIVIADTKLQRLGSVQPWYFTNAKRVLNALRRDGVDLIPCIFPIGYAEGMLANDPNLAEGEPVLHARYRVQSGVAKIVATPGETFQNGDMEMATGEKLASMGFQDSPGVSTFIDRSVFKSGHQSLRIENPIAGMPGVGNCRIQQEVPVTPHRQYRVTAWVKTADFDRASNFAIRVFDPEMKPLTTQEVHVGTNQDWVQVSVLFNSREARRCRIYLGVWEGNQGKMWLDDVELQEVGMVNLIRRRPDSVKVQKNGTDMKPGDDFVIVPPESRGFSSSAQEAVLKLADHSRAQEGDLLDVSFEHATISADNQVAICMGDPSTYALMTDEAKRVNELFSPSQFFFSHDEIRSANRDRACAALHLDAGALLAMNARRAFDIVKSVSPRAECFIWSDMFDPNHNARANYYDVAGDLTGSWAGLPKDAVIVNWYFAARAKNLQFFSAHGWRQILAGFYDHDPTEIATWLKSANGVKGVDGVMYTTWTRNFSQLEAFAKAAGFLPAASSP